MDFLFSMTERHEGIFDTALYHAVRNLVGTYRRCFQGFFKQAGIKVAYPGGPDFSLPEEDIDRFHGFFDGSCRVGPMNLVQVDIVGTQPAKAVFTFPDHGFFSGKAVDIDFFPVFIFPGEIVLTLPGIPAEAVFGQDLNSLRRPLMASPTSSSLWPKP